MQIGRSSVSANRKSSVVAVSQTPQASSRSIDMASLPIVILGFAPQTRLPDFCTNTGSRRWQMNILRGPLLGQTFAILTERLSRPNFG
jgi:hypothetical protein